MDLSGVSQTAILLLIARAVESTRKGSDFNDPMTVRCLERMISAATEEDRRWILKHKRLYQGIGTRDSKAGVKRLKTFDGFTSRFIADNPSCTVINLACGFDTRFWRIENERCRYIEIDLPGVINLKKELLQDAATYEMIGTSVTDTSWIDLVTKNGNSKFLLIAEGLFMWLPQQENTRIFKELGEKFVQSQMVLDMVPAKYTRGLWKPLMRLHSRLDWGLDVAWESGIEKAEDIEAYSPGIKVIAQQKGTTGPIITAIIKGAG